VTNEGEYRPISPIFILKLVAMATSLERSEKGKINNLRPNTYHNDENFMKIGKTDPEIG